MSRAITRGIPSSFTRALTAARLDSPIDVTLARAHHAIYRDALSAMGAAIDLLDPDEAYPDCVFVEDTAVVAARLALIARPGAESRRGETAAIANVLAGHCEIARMTAPATLDGGDCMRVGTTIYVGRSGRTNSAGVAALAAAFAPRGFRIVALELPPNVLHLKCICSPLGDDRILLADDSIPAEQFTGLEIIRVPQAETYAANAVAIGAHVLVAAEFPQTHDVLARAGFTLHLVPTTEVRKADGSLTCQSIVF